MSGIRGLSVSNKIAWLVVLFVFAGAIAGCDNNPVDPGSLEADFVSSLLISPNPSGYAPLTAELALTTTRPVQVEVLVPGRNGAMTDARHLFEGMTQEITIPVLGLFPGENEVTLLFYDEAGAPLGNTTATITAGALISDMPTVTIDDIDAARMKPGMNLVSYFGHDGQFRPMKPMIFDANGDVRWYLDFTNHPILNDLFYDNGVERLANGNLFFGDQSSARIIEMDMLGNIVNDWDFPGFEFHHSIIEKPNGNFVVTVSALGAPTIEDYIIEIDRQSGDIIRTWDLNQSLEYGRRVWVSPFVAPDIDWIHGNGLAYDPSDNTIIVSGRTQGTIKLTNANEVVWIIAPHRDWGMAGNGVDLNTKLLQPLDADGIPISDQNVLDGFTNHPDFEWAWYQHAPELLPDGTLLIFDNGDRRNYEDTDLYSRAVLYRVDPVNMEIEQVWQYGKERGVDTFSRIVSDVDYHAQEGNIVFMPGAANAGQGPYGKVVEVDMMTDDVVFEATIQAPTAQFGITFHRVERISIYPPNGN